VPDDLVAILQVPPYTIQPGATQEVRMVLVAGPENDVETDLVVLSNDPARAEIRLSLHIDIVRRPVLDVLLNTLDLGDVVVGTSQDLAFTISNVGLEPLTGSTGLDNTLFTVFPADFTLDPGGSREIRISFATTSTGFAGSVLTISSNGGDARVEVTARGITGTPAIQVQSESVDFGDVLVNNKGEKTLTLSNTGNANLNVTSITISGSQSEEFSVVASSFAVAPGESHTLTVSFIRGSAGVRTGSLTLHHDALGATSEVSLSGTGVQNSVRITVASSLPGTLLGVDGVTAISSQTIDWVIGSEHTISAHSPQGDDLTRYVFSSWSDGGASSHTVIAPENETTYTVTYATEHKLAVNVLPQGSGTIIQAPTGEWIEEGTDVSLTAVPSVDFLFSSWSGNLAGSNAILTFSMNSSKAVIATFVEAGSVQVDPLFITFSNVTVDSIKTETLSLINATPQAVSGEAEISGGDFRLPTTPLAFPIQISKGDTLNIPVSFTPDREGDFSAELKIRITGQDEVSVPLTGVGQPPAATFPVIDVQPQPLDFGVMQTGGTETRALTVTNQGTGTLTVFNIASEESSFDLQNRGDASFDLAPGENKRVQIVVSPTRRGTITGTLTIQSNDPETPNYPVTVQVDVEGPPGPTFTVLTAPVDFGQVGFGEREEFELIVKNEGVAPGQIFGVRPDNNQIRATSQIPVTVQPDNTVAIVLAYTPLPYRSRVGEITLFTENEENLRVKVGWQADEVPVTAVEVSRTNPRDRDGDVGSEPIISVRFSEELLRIGRNFIATDIQIQPRPLTPNWQSLWDLSTDGRTLSYPGVQLESDRVYRMTVISALARSGNELINPVDAVFSTGSTSVEDVGKISGVVSLTKAIVQPDGTTIVDTTQNVIGRVIAVDQHDQVVAETTITECGAYELDGLPPDDYKIYVEIEGQDRPINIGIDQDNDNIPDQVTIGSQQSIETFDMVVDDIELTEDAPGAVMFDGDPSAGYQASDQVAVGQDDVVAVALYAEDVENLIRFEAVVEYDNTELQFVDFQMPTRGEEIALLATGDLDQAISASKVPVVDRLGETVTVQENQIKIAGKLLNGSKQNAVSGGGLFGLISFIKTGSAKLAKTTGAQTSSPEIRLKKITLFGVNKKKTIENAGTIVVTEATSTEPPDEDPPTTGISPSPDFDGDGEIAFRDFVMLAQGFSKKVGQDGFNPVMDLDQNGEIGFRDFIIFAQWFGKDPVDY
jgi:hypothetical protein